MELEEQQTIGSETILQIDTTMSKYKIANPSYIRFHMVYHKAQY